MAQFVDDDVQSMLNDAFSTSDNSSESNGSSGTGSQNVDYHQEQYPTYQPPHLRGHNIQDGDKHINFKTMKNGKDNPDKVEGVDNDKYLRMKLAVPFALSRGKLAKLKPQFPGVYFHARDNTNHDHEFSHVVTMIGTRAMQRRYKPGTRILDVYGNPRACERYNQGQAKAADPRTMKACVSKFVSADFIREANKWGPQYRQGHDDEAYHAANLRQMIDSGELEKYDVLQMVHTLYYINFQDLSDALHYGSKRIAYALVHKHQHLSGSINDGEQEYVKKTVFRAGRQINLVKQTNVKTGTEYIHPDLTPLLFGKKKYWLPDESMAFAMSKEERPTKGISFEAHMVNDETWYIEMVPCDLKDLDDVIDYEEMWREDEEEKELASEDFMASTASSSPAPVLRDGTVTVPTNDGEFLVLNIRNEKLFRRLRQNVVGRERTPKLLESTIQLAKHLNEPTALFGNQEAGMECSPEHLYDHALAAFIVDVVYEKGVTAIVDSLKPTLRQHANRLNFGSTYKDLSVRSLFDAIHLGISGAKVANKAMRAADPVDFSLDVTQRLLS